MLVLSRKELETIHIGDEIEIVVRRISKGRVTLAVRAPITMRILRGELIGNRNLSTTEDTEATEVLNVAR